MKKVLGFIVGRNRIGIGVDKEKVKVIRDLPTPKSFYKRETAPLNDLMKNNVVFKWGEMQENALQFS